MAELRVKKVVAVCFLEAAKLVLEHIGTFRHQLAQQGSPGPSDLPRLYGDVRRLRDYLHRCISAFQDDVALQFSERDSVLLVACCRRGVEAIEARLSDRAVPPDEREWMLKKRSVFADWALELAAKPLLELPLTRMSQTSTDFQRTLTADLQNKVFGRVADRKRILPPRTNTSIAQGLSPFGESSVPSEQDPAPPAISLGETLAMLDAETRATEDAARTAAAAAACDPVSATYFAAPEGCSAPSDPAGLRIRSTLLDANTLRDPRLRSLVAMDLAAYERCIADHDWRLATVMLSSVLEAVVIDHAIPRRAELGLTGSPDTWNPNELLLRAMGDAAQPKDRALSYHLFASRNLLRPSRQIVTPSVVTAASFERLREFVRRALHALGFVASVGMPEPGIDSPGRVTG